MFNKVIGSGIVQPGGPVGPYLPDGLLVWHDYRDGVATDKSGNGYDANFVIGASYVAGGLSFDGAGDFVAINDAVPLQITTGPFQWHVWFKTTDAEGEGVILAKQDATEVYLDYDEAGAITCYAPIGVAAISDSSKDWRDGDWHLVTVARVGSTLQGWVDGVGFDSGPYLTAGGSVNDESKSIVVGNNGTGTYCMTGIIAFFMYAKSAEKSIADIAADHAALYAQGVE